MVQELKWRELRGAQTSYRAGMTQPPMRLLQVLGEIVAGSHRFEEPLRDEYGLLTLLIDQALKHTFLVRKPEAELIVT